MALTAAGFFAGAPAMGAPEPEDCLEKCKQSERDCIAACTGSDDACFDRCFEAADVCRESCEGE
jgi:hypothetical protein